LEEQEGLLSHGRGYHSLLPTSYGSNCMQTLQTNDEGHHDSSVCKGVLESWA
jgi:hypothetical protein